MSAPAWRVETVDGFFVRAGGDAGGQPIWLVHGFADSSLAFMPVMMSSVLQNFEWRAPDLPGFGCSPPQPDLQSCDTYAQALAGVIGRTPGRAHLVCHSTGSIVGARVAELLSHKVASMISIEGNLTSEDAYWTGRVASFDSADLARDWYCDMVWARGAADPVFRRYFASVIQADAASMWRFAKDVACAGSGAEYARRLESLEIPKLYYWGRANTSVRTREYLGLGKLPNLEFHGCGHWPMLERPAQTAAVIRDVVEAATV